MGILNLNTCATTARFAGITHTPQLRIVVYVVRLWGSQPEFVSNLGKSGLRGARTRRFVRLLPPPTAEATAAADHDGREPPHGLKLWYCGVVWCGFERFLFDRFYLRGVLYWRRNLCDVRPHHTTMGIPNLNLKPGFKPAQLWVRWHRTQASPNCALWSTLPGCGAVNQNS